MVLAIKIINMKHVILILFIFTFSCKNNNPNNDQLMTSDSTNLESHDVNNKFSEEQNINISSSEDECMIIKLVVDKTIKEENLDSARLERTYVRWDEEMYFDFKVDGRDLLPKTEEERMKRFRNPSEMDFYPIFFLFADPQLDKMFTNEDRNFMRTQISKNPEGFNCINVGDIPIASKQQQLRGRMAVTKPLFNRDKTKAAIVVHCEHGYGNDGMLLLGLVQNFYLIKESQGWRIKFATMRYIAG